MTMTAQEKRKQFKKLLLQPICTPLPGVYDALGARIIEKAGFDTVYVGSFATSASVFGMPDVTAVSLAEMCDHARHIANCVDLPLIADAENGFTHAANIWRTVREFENAGVAAIHIEDHEFGKHTNLPLVYLSCEKMCNKIKAAVDARTDENFLIFARTDVGPSLGVPEMLQRANAYLEAGADAAFIIYFDEITKEMRDQVKGPLLALGTPKRSIKQDTEIGLNAAFYFPLLLSAAFYSMREAAQQFKTSGDYGTLGKYLVKDEEICEYIGMDDFVERVKKYM
jgi:methylisocitrate lyase